MKKEVEVAVPFAQGRRLNCDSCGQPFTYLHFGIRYEQNRDVLWEVSSEELQCWALKFALRWVRHEVLTKRRGLGLCPHCKCYQRWMVLKSYLDRALLAIFVGPVLLGGVPFIYMLMDNPRWRDWSWLYITLAVIGGVGGFFLGRCFGLRRGPHDEDSIPTSKTDEQLRDLLSGYEEGDAAARPAAGWMTSIKVPMPAPWIRRITRTEITTDQCKELIIDGGFRDEGTPPLVPEFFHSRPAIDRAEARLKEEEKSK